MQLKLFFPAGLAFFFWTSPICAQDCSVPFIPSQFKARLAWQSGQDGPSSLATPVVANMNPQVDSMPEIIVAEASANGLSNKIQFYRGDGSNANNPMVLTVPGNFDNYPVPGPTVGDVDGDGIPELLMSCNDSKIRIFHNYTENPVAPMQLWITATGLLNFVDERPLLADFDGDGIPEVYAGSDIYKFDFSNPVSPTLTKVIAGPMNRGRAFYNNFNEGSCNPTAVDILSVADCGGDPDCAGLELVAGPVIYSIDLNPNDGDGYQIKVQRDLNTMVPPPAGYADGYTAVADVDLDGILDVVVTSRRANNQTGAYVWNKTGLKRFFPYPVNTVNSGSLACIGNLYDDTKAGFAQDFPEILVCSSMNLTCFNMHAASANPAGPYWWNLPTTDFSGWTGSSVYDFNGDGIAEIVYRDERDFRILYGGPAPFPPGVDAERNWHKIPSWSPTSDEYPVVADVDNDGETEIVLTGRLSGGVFFNSRGRLRVFESDAEPWVPSRNVWNQYNYFIVNVNDDLSIPAIQQPQQVELPATGSGNRPFNRYLSQRPVLNANFEPFIPLPDAQAQVLNVTCKFDSLMVDLNICNTGDQTLHSNIPVTFYLSDPTSTNAPQLGIVQHTDAPVKKDSCKVFQFTIPKISGGIFGVINDDASTPTPFQLGADFPVTNELECNWLNNLFTFKGPDAAPLLNLGPDLGACTDTLVVLDAGAGFVDYHWQDGSMGSVFEVQQPGLYWVETTDHCALKHLDSLQVVLFEHPGIQLDTINGDCFGNQASVTASSNGSYLPVMYLWSTGDKVASLSGLPDGEYTVTVTNGKGCTSTRSTWVEAGGNLLASLAVVSPVRCFGETGALQIDFTIGKPPYTFQWSDGSAAQGLTNIPSGDYAVTVTDADHCIQALQISLPQPEALLSSGLSTSPACPGESNGEATFLGAAQGTPPYALMWSNSANTAVLNGLAAGTYQVTLSDTQGCTLTEAATVAEFQPPVSTENLADISCFGRNDGSIAVTVVGGTPGFDFLWSNGATTSSIDNLEPGNYSLTLQYANGICAQKIDYQINEPPPLLLSGISTPATCNGGYGGSIDLSVQNGVAPLSFLWSNNASLEDLSNLQTGTYQVTVTDAMGCSQIFQEQVAELPPVTVAVNSTQPRCAGNADGSIQLSSGGGVPPFQFTWSNGGSSAGISGVLAGNYSATVTDAAACTAVISLNLEEPLPLMSAGIAATPACPGLANGSALFLGASQGTPPYLLQWSNNNNSTNLDNLSAGTYQLTITDAQGCLLVQSIEVPEYVAPTIAHTITEVSCFAESNGALEVTVLSGSPGYGYLWSNNATTSSIDNLPSGYYSMTLTYANSICSQTFDYSITEPTPIALVDTLVTPVACFGGSNGAVDLLPNGGTPPYQFHWGTGQQTQNINNLGAGAYALTLTDAKDCPFMAHFDIPQPNALAINAIVQADTCQSSSGIITTSSSGGIPPYLFAWSNAGTNPQIAALSAGLYTLTLTDSHGCTQLLPIQVPAYGVPPALTTITDIITCVHPEAAIGVSANQGGLQYNWSAPGGALPNQAMHSVQQGGQYQVTVSNSFGCQSTAQLQVLEDKQHPTAEAGPPNLRVLCSETSLLLSGTGSSQGPIFSNQWTRLSNNGSPVFDTAAVNILIFEPGLYVHRVVNTVNGCTAQDSILVDWDPPIKAVLTLDPIRCFGDKGGIHLKHQSGGTPPFYYSIDNQNFTAKNDYYGLQPGIYPLAMHDDHDCWWESEVVLTSPEQLSVMLTASDTAIELGQTVWLNAKPNPANTVLDDITWGPNDLHFEPSSLQQRQKPEANTAFSVRIVDSNGCIAEDRLWVNVYNHHIYIPNIIYPGSTENGGFTVFGGGAVLGVRLLRIFDRWGDLMFERRGFPVNDQSLGWDGTFRGKALDPGVFAWYAEVELHDGRVLLFKGDVTVLR